MRPPVAVLVSRLEARRNGKGWIAKCPMHDDRDPSLSISEGSDGRALIKCHAGCDTNDVLAALGLTLRDVFPGTTYPEPSGNGTTSTPKPRSPLDWQVCVDALTDLHLDRLAGWRGYKRDFLPIVKGKRFYRHP